MQPSGKQPDYDLTFMNKVTEEKGKIGAAWTNDGGSISIVLNPMVRVIQDKNVVLRLFKRTPYQGGGDVRPPQVGKYTDQSALNKAREPKPPGSGVFENET